MQLYKTAQRSFTLIEVLIALSLTVTIMSILSYFFLQIQEINIKSENSLKEIYQLSYLQSRLSDVLPKAISETNSKNDFMFYTSKNANSEFFKPESSSLVFTYNNGADLNKQFANHVLGRLFIDQDNQLVLATFPSFKRWKKDSIPEMKKEILLEGVTQLSFSFFIPHTTDRTKVVNYDSKIKNKKISTPEPSDSWINEWKFEYYELPAIIKIHLQQNKLDKTNRELTFTFPLPNSPNVIFYTQ